MSALRAFARHRGHSVPVKLPGQKESSHLMSRVKVVLLGLVAMFAASAMAAGPALALENKYFEQPKVEITSSAIEGSVGTAWLQSSLSGQKILIESAENAFEEGKILKEGKSEGKIKYKKPILYTIKEGKKENTSATCTVAPIEFKFKDKLFTQTKGGVVADEFEPGTEGSKIFIEIKIEGTSCLLKGTFAVEGTYNASLGGQGEEDRTEHELIFTEAGSNVTFDKATAAYTNTVSKLKQTNKKEWYVD
jgi:hypothetical protein